MGVAAADARVVEQYVQVPKFFHSCVYHTGAILCICHVRLDSERLPPHCLDLFGNLTGSLPFDIYNGEVRAKLGEVKNSSAPDAAATAGYQDDFLIKAEQKNILLSSQLSTL